MSAKAEALPVTRDRLPTHGPGEAPAGKTAIYGQRARLAAACRTAGIGVDSATAYARSRAWYRMQGAGQVRESR